MAKFSFLIGAAAGYVLGARAGHERYLQIKRASQQLWSSEPVQAQVAQAKHAAKTKAAPAALDAVSGVARTAGERLRASANRIPADPSRDIPSTLTDDTDATSAQAHPS
ncbi:MULTISPECIES: protoporphyrinogen oxidase [unclassified Janibacter]|uniref:protoporphyrinogen oxidase n=1 Tax=unclassified Janibacter TaxID=2649294 RepID=UPI003D05FD6F